MEEQLIAKSIRVQRKDWDGFRVLCQLRGEHNWKTFEYVMKVFYTSHSSKAVQDTLDLRTSKRAKAKV